MDAPSFEYDFFVSRRGPVAAVAEEVADVLEAEDYKVLVQDYDAERGGSFPLFIHDALVKARHLIILYSADYDTTHWTRQEFGHFLAAPDAKEAERRICVLRCDAADPRGLLAGVVYGDLHTIQAPDARRREILAVARGEARAGRAPGPRIFGGGMPAENRLFTGRDELLDGLHAALSSGPGAAVLTQAAVHGLGGVGKTALARHYVAEHAGDYGGVWWITATDPLAIRTGLLGLARALDPRLPADIAVDDAAAAALGALATRAGTPFLLIYDNVPAPDVLDGLLPPRGACVLITSREPDWDATAASFVVDTLPEDLAAAFLQRRAEREDPAGALVLARALDGLPLALDHAGAYVKRAGIGFADYTRRVEALIAVKPPPGVQYPASVAATFGLAIEAAVREAPAAEALLGLCAWLAPEAIPLVLAEQAIPSETDREAAAMALRSVSLLSAVADTACGPAVSVHRLVQAVMRARLGERDVAEESRGVALAALVGAFPNDAFRNPEPWPRCRALMPHVRGLLGHLEGQDFVELGLLLDNAGSFLHGSGAARDGAALLYRALGTRERVLGPEHPDTLTSRNNLAGCLQAMGDLAAAEPLYRAALAGAELVLGVGHPTTVIFRANLKGVTG